MVKHAWNYFGASVRGPGHIRHQLPNQDAFCLYSYAWGKVAVVSDGVGSCATSEYGSRAACKAVGFVAKKQALASNAPIHLGNQIHEQWLQCIKPHSPETSSATCLFAICSNDSSVTVGMLGDGLVAALKSDGSYVELAEDKNSGFSNQTKALTVKNQSEFWQIISFASNECIAVMLCTDGVSDDLLPEQRENFVRHIFEQGKKCPVKTARREIGKMLENWPVPKHSDDKTLVCIYKCEVDA